MISQRSRSWLSSLLSICRPQQVLGLLGGALLGVLSAYVTAPVKGERGAQMLPLAVVSAASFEEDGVAPEAIVTAFGSQLATRTVVATDDDLDAPGLQLPTELDGTTVEVNGRLAQLLFVSP